MYLIPIINELRRRSESTEVLAALLLGCLGCQVIGLAFLIGKLLWRSWNWIGHLASEMLRASTPGPDCAKIGNAESIGPVECLSPERLAGTSIGPATGRQLDFSGIDIVNTPAGRSSPLTPDFCSPLEDPKAAEEDRLPPRGRKGPEAPEEDSPCTPELAPSPEMDQDGSGLSSRPEERCWPYLGNDSFDPQAELSSQSPPTPTLSPDAPLEPQPYENGASANPPERVDIIDLLSSEDEQDRLSDAPPRSAAAAEAAHQLPQTSQQLAEPAAETTSPRRADHPRLQQNSVKPKPRTASPNLGDARSFWASFQPPKLSSAVTGKETTTAELDGVSVSRLVGSPPEAKTEQPDVQDPASDPRTPPSSPLDSGSEDSPLVSTARRSALRPRKAAVILVDESSDEEADGSDPYEFGDECGSPPVASSFSSRVTSTPAQTGAGSRPSSAAAAMVTGQPPAVRREPLASLPHSNQLAPAMTPAAFRKKRPDLVKGLFTEFNRSVFEDRLPPDMEISWSANLTTTAGVTHYSRKPPAPGSGGDPIYSARIELSSKVLDTEEKLRATLCHELCHAAAWLLDHNAKPPHGPVFKKWAARAMEQYPGLSVTTCHQYKIHYPFRWRCTSPECGREFGRHSNSIDVSRQRCGRCHGVLEYLGRFKADGTPAAKRKASAFSLFVGENFARTKADLQEAGAGHPPSHTEVMRRLSELWREQQQSSQATARNVQSELSKLVTSAAALALPASPTKPC